MQKYKGRFCILYMKFDGNVMAYICSRRLVCKAIHTLLVVYCQSGICSQFYHMKLRAFFSNGIEHVQISAEKQISTTKVELLLCSMLVIIKT